MPNPAEPGDGIGYLKVFAMLNCYLDESGIHEGAKVCVVGGYFAGRGQWRKFEGSWNQILEKHEVPLEEFHAKDLLKCAGFFYKWSDAESQALQMNLAEAVAEYKIYPVAQGVLVEEFFKLSLSERKFMTGATLTPRGRLKDSGNPRRPYFAPFQQIVKKVLGYAPVGGRGHFFLGLGSPLAENASELYSVLKNNDAHPYKERFGNISFPLAKRTPPLQASDLLVHVMYLDMLKYLVEGGNLLMQPSPLMKLLIAHIREGRDLSYQDASLMRETMREIPVEQRGDLFKEGLI